VKFSLLFTKKFQSNSPLSNFLRKFGRMTISFISGGISVSPVNVMVVSTKDVKVRNNFLDIITFVNRDAPGAKSFINKTNLIVKSDPIVNRCTNNIIVDEDSVEAFTGRLFSLSVVCLTRFNNLTHIFMKVLTYPGYIVISFDRILEVI